MMMKRFCSTILTVAACSVYLTTLASAKEPQVELQRNPFQVPDVDEMATAAARSYEDPTTTQRPGLRAVLVAGSKSVVNIGGVILQLGECTGTYCLLAVEEGQAMISRNDEQVVLSLYKKNSSEEQ